MPGLKALSLTALFFASACSHRVPSPRVVNFENDTVVYSISPVIRDRRIGFDVEMAFRGSSTGESRLLLPSRFSSRLIVQDLGTFSEPNSVASIPIRHQPYERVSIRYQVWPEKVAFFPQKRTIRFNSNERSFFFSGAAFFTILETDAKKPIRVILQWKNIPDRWVLANSYGVNEARQVLELSFSELLESFFMGGRLEFRKTVFNRQTVYIAMRGDPAIFRGPFHKMTSRMIQSQLEFWDDAKPGFLLLPLIQVSEQCCVLQSVPFQNAMATFFSKNQGGRVFSARHFSEGVFQYLMSQRIRFRETRRNMAWFTEGVMRFLSSSLNLSTGVASLEDHVENHNRLISSYYTSVLRKGPNQFLAVSGQDPDLKSLMSSIGTILAHNWNYEIVSGSNGRFFLRDLIRSVKQDGDKRSESLTPRDLNVLILPYLSRGISSDLHRYIELGELLHPEAKALGPCVELGTKVMPAYDLGFNLKTSKLLNEIAGVDPQSAAYASGMRDGQKLISWSMTQREDPNLTEARFFIQDDGNGAVKELSYSPRHQGIIVPQYRVLSRRTQRERASCLKWVH